MSLKAFLREMEGRRKTVTVFAHEPQFGLGNYFGARHVTVEYERLPPHETEEFVTVSEGEEFLGSIAFESLTALDSPVVCDPGSADVAEADLRHLFELLDDTLFSSFDRRKMLATSREIEDRAVRVGRGTLYAGFQNLSAYRDQTDVYRDIAAVPGLEVHVYGQPDWDPPLIPDVTVHRILNDEIGDVWFVAYDGGGDDDYKCALLAEERSPGEFYGFWTYDPTLVDDVVGRIERAFTRSTDLRTCHDVDDGNETP